MAIIDSKTSRILNAFSIEHLIEKAKEMRAYNMISLCAAGSGHTGGTLSIMDIAAVLYLKVINHDPAYPEWDDRDRVFWSAGHKAPALYVALGMSGYFPIEETVKLRKQWAGFEGHPSSHKLPGVELSSGSLGQGLGVAVGSALMAKLDKKSYNVYCIMGDGEQQEGSVWEAAMSASHYHLDNLIAIVDVNGLQIDGKVQDVMNIEPLADKYRAFGWEVIHTDGHDIEGLVKAFNSTLTKKNKPFVILARTIKGKGVKFAENTIRYHGISPRDGRSGAESLEQALNDIYGGAEHMFTKERIDYLLAIADDYQKTLDKRIKEILPNETPGYWWNSSDIMKVRMESTRDGFGRAIEIIGQNENVIALGADITGSIKMDSFYRNHPDRKERFFSVGIAEQNMTVVAAGLAKEGKTTFIGSYGIFISGRNWDQLRTTCCYNNFNVKIAGAHGGLSVGPDGATHQALEEIALLYYLPNMKILSPCDALETMKATLAMAENDGPCYLRYSRGETPIVTQPDTAFRFGTINIIRFRRIEAIFIDGFDFILSNEYENEHEPLSIIATGPIVSEVMRAAWILKQEYNIEVRILNVHTIKPIDRECILKAAAETKNILTVEEHQVGGFGNIIAGIIAQGKVFSQPFKMDMIGINDRFGESGKSMDLLKTFGLAAECIVKRAKILLNIY
jgi:transketolase